MRKEKIEEAEKHLAKMEELLKAQGDITFLCESVCEKRLTRSGRSRFWRSRRSLSFVAKSESWRQTSKIASVWLMS